MCGFFGYLETGPGSPSFDRIVTERVKTAISRRGGDDENYVSTEKLTCFHSRLSVQGTAENGAQPFFLDDKIMLFNGNVSNFMEIATEYDLGFEPGTTPSDTEVIAKIYARIGPKCFSLFNGFFAIVIICQKTGKVTLARDRLGQKPLYYGARDGKFFFSSTLDLFFELDFPRDPTAVLDFFNFGFVPSPKTIFKPVKAVEAGSIESFSIGSEGMQPVLREKFWEIEFNYIKRSYGEAQEELQSKLYASLQRNLLANRTVASLFSGGVDSSIILGMVAKQQNNNVAPFTLRFDGDELNERYGPIIDELGIEKHFVAQVSRDDIIDMSRQIAKITDSYFDDTSIIPSTLMFKTACENGFRVLLTGDGADELFLGYRYFDRFRKFTKLSFINGCVQSSSLFTKAIDALPFLSEHNKYYLNTSPNDVLQAIFRTGFDLSDLSGELDNSYDPNHHLTELLARHDGLSSYEKLRMLSIDFKLKNQMLYKVDRAAGFNGCEARPIFLDNEIVDFALTLDESLMLQNGTKSLLKSIYADIYDNEVHKMDKIGFGIAGNDLSWLLTDNDFDVWRSTFHLDVEHFLKSRQKNNKRGWFALKSFAQIHERRAA